MPKRTKGRQGACNFCVFICMCVHAYIFLNLLTSSLILGIGRAVIARTQMTKCNNDSISETGRDCWSDDDVGTNWNLHTPLRCLMLPITSCTSCLQLYLTSPTSRCVKGFLESSSPSHLWRSGCTLMQDVLMWGHFHQHWNQNLIVYVPLHVSVWCLQRITLCYIWNAFLLCHAHLYLWLYCNGCNGFCIPVPVSCFTFLSTPHIPVYEDAVPIYTLCLPCP